MNQFFHVLTNTVMSEEEARLVRPSFTNFMSDAELLEAGFHRVLDAVQIPTPGPYQSVREIPPEFVDGRYFRAYEVVDLFQSDATDPETGAVVLTIDAQKAAYDARKMRAKEREYTEFLQRHLDEVAREKGYDDIRSAALRAALPSSPFHAEGVAFGEWMDAVWAAGLGIVAQVRSGARAAPTFDELLAELPALVLPGDSAPEEEPPQDPPAEG